MNTKYAKHTAFILYKRTDDLFNEIKNEFDNFIYNLNNYSESHKKSTAKKILKKLDNLNLSNLEHYLEHLEADKIDTYHEKFENAKYLESYTNYMYKTLNSLLEKPEKIKEFKPSKEETDTEYIINKFNFLKNEYENSVDINYEQIISEFKKLESKILNLDFEKISDDKYDEMLNIRNELPVLRKHAEATYKSETYGEFLPKPLYYLVRNYLGKKKEEDINNEVAYILDNLEKQSIIELFEPTIKKIINRTITEKGFRAFYKALVAAANQDKDKFKSFEEYDY